MPEQSLAGRVALVTGGGTGIGRAAALALARAGAAVGIHFNRSERSAEEALAQVKSMGGRATLHKGDLTVEQQVDAVVDGVVGELGRLDILFNNAGSPIR